MLSKKYNYQDDEPIIKKARKPREKKVKEVKVVEEPEVYKIIRETREARQKPNTIKYEELEEDDDEEENRAEQQPTSISNNLPMTVSASGARNMALNAFHPLTLKTHPIYDDKIVDTLKTENEELKKHLTDLRKLHTFNDRLNHINHSVHRMKIKLSQF